MILGSSNPTASFAVNQQSGCATITARKLEMVLEPEKSCNRSTMHRRLAKVAFVIAIEARGVIVTYSKGRLRGSEIFIKH